jgi:hypothetical protein
VLGEVATYCVLTYAKGQAHKVCELPERHSPL